MNNSPARDLYNSISHSLLSSKWLEEICLTPQFIKKFILSPEFIDRINRMVDTKDYSCASTLMLCESMMNSISSQSSPESWLDCAYSFAQGLSFPESAGRVPEEYRTSCQIYLRVLSAVSRQEMYSEGGTFLSMYPLRFLSDEEEDRLEHPSEYRHFLQSFHDDYVVEMMKLSSELFGYNTLDHICGVHYISIMLGRQFEKLGFPIDLGRVSGGAAGHDIGKYGCKPNEMKRVPYLHYYYTDQWFKRHGITYIRNIALNHSTWDLELENLPLESLILIYSDFRVKNIDKKMRVLSLSESFDVILSKLDNLDSAKEKRYKRVYAKLKDFEGYMLHLGINVDPSVKDNLHPEKKEFPSCSLLQGSEIIDNLKYLAIEHNIKLMYQFRDEYSLDSILQLARSEKDWNNLREYVRAFEEYSTYLTQKQKLQTIGFLYELLIHPEEDIRKQSAQLIGTLIATYDEEYRKEIPEDARVLSSPPESIELLDEYMRLFLYPGHNIIPSQRSWIGYSTGIMIGSLFARCGGSLCSLYKNVCLKYFDIHLNINREVKLYLLKAGRQIPAAYGSPEADTLLRFSMNMLKTNWSMLRISALESICSILPYVDKSSALAKDLKSYFEENASRSGIPAENFLKYRAAAMLGIDSGSFEELSYSCRSDKEKIPDIFLSNLKTETDWATKDVQLDILLYYALEKPEVNGLYTALHFCNLLKVSEFEIVRTHAGEALLKIMPRLPLEQRNDVTVELLRALEIEGYHFSEYIPRYLGQLVLWLQTVEFDEIIDDMVEKIKGATPKTKSLLLKTIGICIEHYHLYAARFSIGEGEYNIRLKKMLGILLNGLGNYNSLVKQVAFGVIGRDIFDSSALSLKQKETIFGLIAKKMLTLLTESKGEELLFLINSAGLNHIYRFISDYTFFNGVMNFNTPQKIAFFPGTFDPFTLSHKEIVKSIRDMGFEVYLSVDEFSWSKRTLPTLLRRKIINISIADELDVYLFPENIPVNIANPGDLSCLKRCFSGMEVYIVVGSDVILNASSYSTEKAAGSVFYMPHIIIEREKHGQPEKEQRMGEIIKNIEGKVIMLSLPKKYAGISSTRIRDNIDKNRDISSLVDPLVQQYIYDNGFYQREPQDKAPLQSSLSIDIVMDETFSPELLREISHLPGIAYDEAANIFISSSRIPSSKIILAHNFAGNNALLGFSILHRVDSAASHIEFNDPGISQYMRANTFGRVIFIDAIFTDGNQKEWPMEQILLTETLSYALSRDYQFAVCGARAGKGITPVLREVLEEQGFVRIDSGKMKNEMYLVNMVNPCILNLDVETVMKEPFRSSARVRQAVMGSRKKLQNALVRLYPGELVLSMDINIQHEKLIKKICSENGVPWDGTKPGELGPSMCAPYGNILDWYRIPNTVTKALHTEKFFAPDMNSFHIGASPHYLDLEVQAKTIHSFNRPVILVDDLLHKGYRIKSLMPIFLREEIKIQKIIVGILSGRGKELMDRENINVDSVYFIPRLRLWFNENLMYPFIGGDALWRGVYYERNLLPSINLILPYTSPKFIRGASESSIYNLSKTSIENSLDILTAIEDEYHLINERKLTLSHLGEVFIAPRCPDHGMNMDYDLNTSPSHFLKNDLELLQRLENVINNG